MPKRGENIYKRKDGRWEGRYIIDRNICKIKYGYIYAKSYTEVKQKLNEAKVKFSASHIIDNNTTLKNAALLWLEHVKLNVKHSTYVKYYNIVHNHIITTIGNYKLHAINNEVIQNFADYKMKCGMLNGKGGLSVKTTKDLVSVIRLILKYSNTIGTNCLFNIYPINIKTSAANVKTLNKEQQELIFTYLMKNMNNTNLGILICLYTGIRIGEICALKFSDISLREGGIVNICIVRKYTKFPISYF